MRNLFLTVLLFIATTSSAQVIKSNTLKSYKEGDMLEKGIYSDKKDAIAADTWQGAFASKPVEGAISPIIGCPLTYKGYKEDGPSIAIGFPEGVKGSRNSVFAMTDSGKKYSKGTFYLSFLVDFSKLGSNDLAEFLSLNASHVGGSNRGQVLVAREGRDKIRFELGLQKNRNQAPMAYDYNKTHLLVVKVDYSANQLSLFINPDLEASEPVADVIVNGDEGALTAGLRAFSVRNRSGYAGNIGNFRFTKSWTDVFTL